MIHIVCRSPGPSCDPSRAEGAAAAPAPPDDPVVAAETAGTAAAPRRRLPGSSHHPDRSHGDLGRLPAGRPARGSVGHSGTNVTEPVYRHQIRPVIQTGATIMYQLFGQRGSRASSLS